MKTKLFLLILLAALAAVGLYERAAAGENNGADRLPQIEAKLDQVLLNQAEIFKSLEKIEQELAIIKVRATSRLLFCYINDVKYEARQPEAGPPLAENPKSKFSNYQMLKTFLFFLNHWNLGH
ncbi:MAG: hypothetical protein V1662_00535 [Candidatus Omnitrophota bacterium]